MSRITTTAGAEVPGGDIVPGTSALALSASSSNLDVAHLSQPIEDTPLESLQTTANRDSHPARTSRSLLVVPTRSGNGFTASIHGHMLELADPTDHRLAPGPDDLMIASIASELAWSARRFLRALELPDDVSVSARWQTTEGLPSLADITLTVAVSTRAKAVSGALSAALANSLAARSLAEPVVHVSLEGGHR